MINKKNLWKTADNHNIEERMRKIQSAPVPEQIAIIMDGNGRWAKKRALPRVAGHHEGMKTVKRIAKLANRLGVKVLTLYAFSTENWKRPKAEVEFLMKLPQEFLNSFLPDLMEENIRVEMMGDETQIPSYTLKAVQRAMEETSGNDGLILNFALNYGSRAEILMAVKNIIQDAKNDILLEENLNEDLFSSYLMTNQLKDPDLLIRTSGEVRLSNFMLWQLAYTEFWFTDVNWPDFKDVHLFEAVEAFQKRSRRFGGLS